MQKIEKRPEPLELTEWRQRHAGDSNFGYDLLCGKQAHDAVMHSLLAEQGGLCAYTGIAIRGVIESPMGMIPATAHVEHLLPQEHCTAEESVTYRNLAACFPGPNAPPAAFGAPFKKSWPSREEWHLFVSPLSEGCETRFSFNRRGEVSAARQDDHAAVETIRRLGLDKVELTRLRHAALQPLLRLDPKQMRTRLNAIARESSSFTQFRFVVRQVLARRLLQIEAARRTVRAR